MKKVLASILLVCLTLASCNSSDVKEKIEDEGKKKDEVMMSADISSPLFTSRQLEGYHYEHEFMEGCSYKTYLYDDYDDYKITTDYIVSEDGTQVYTTDNGEIKLFTKYGDEVFFNECWETGCGDDCFLTFKALNVKTKKTRRLYRVFDDSMGTDVFKPKMIYKDFIYYVQRNPFSKLDDGFTPIGCVSIADMKGTHVEHIEIPNYSLKSKFLGIAYDRMYYTSSTNKELAGIESCDLYGENYKEVADGFKIRLGSLDYDDEGWYFIGGKEAPYENLCKLDFETGEAKEVTQTNSSKVTVDVKNENAFAVKDECIYYIGKGGNVYCYNKDTQEAQCYYEQPVYCIRITGESLYYRLDPKKTSIKKSRDWYRINLAIGDKKPEKVSTMIY